MTAEMPGTAHGWYPRAFAENDEEGRLVPTPLLSSNPHSSKRSEQLYVSA